jgi:ribosomal protein L6P/L9E
LTTKTRVVTVKGPKGTITKDFRHMPVEMSIVKQNIRKRKGNYLNIKMWFGGSKQTCSVTTLKSLIRNMVTGVTEVSLEILKSFVFVCLLQIINYKLMKIGLQIQDETRTCSLPH